MPETSIIVKTEDRYSSVLKNMSNVTKAFDKESEHLERTLHDLSGEKSILQAETDKARRTMKEAQRQFAETHSEADRLRAVLILTVITNIITEVLKEVLTNLPTNILALLVAMVVTLLAVFSVLQIMNIAATWYLVCAAVGLGFLVSFAAMFWIRQIEADPRADHGAWRENQVNRPEFVPARVPEQNQTQRKTAESP